MQANVRSSTLARKPCLKVLRCRPEISKSGLHRPFCPPIVRNRTFAQTHRRVLSVNRNTNWSYTRRKDVMPTQDTIYALSTASGRAAIAVIRISGPACLDIYGSLCPDKAFPVPRLATLRKLKDPEDDTRLLDPGALILYFPAPNTVTGEDVLELHCHGGIAIVRSVMDALSRCSAGGRARRKPAEYSKIRVAEAGEFTKRAFYNARIDLVQAEGLGEALNAETEMQRRLAVESQSGGLAVRYEEWRALLLEARGEMEALIDFSEDQHFDESPRELVQSVAKQVSGLKGLIERHVSNARKGELLREGVSVALLGPPNAGKSSLLNLIVGREAAIVTAEAGTTRDIVDVSVDLGGWLIRLGDMAGLRGKAMSGKETVHEMNEALRRKERDTLGLEEEVAPIGIVEQEGIRRARARALESDVIILLVPVYTNAVGTAAIDLATELVEAVRECRDAGKEILFVLNKVDLIPNDRLTSDIQSLKEVVKTVLPDMKDEAIVSISCRNASTASSADPGNIQLLLRTLTSLFADMTSASGPSVSGMQRSQAYWHSSLSVSHRQAQYLKECLGHLNEFLEMSRPLSKPDHQVGGSHYYDGHQDIVGERADSADCISIETNLDHPPYYSTYSRYPISETDLDIVLSAEHLRAAAMCLAKITGRGEGGDVEAVLGVVFEKFCVGK